MAGQSPLSDSHEPALSQLIKQHLLVLSHDIANLQENIRAIDGRTTGLAARADIAKLETQLDRLAAEKSLLVRKEEFSEVKTKVASWDVEKDFINEARGTFAMMKWMAASAGALLLMLLGSAITLHQSDMSSANEVAKRVTKFEGENNFLEHQILGLTEFKREVEEQGSPILRAAIKDLAQMREDLKESRAELKALANTFDRTRIRDRPDIEDTKQ